MQHNFSGRSKKAAIETCNTLVLHKMREIICFYKQCMHSQSAILKSGLSKYHKIYQK